MVRKIVSATVSAALCLASVTPALAQDYRFTGFDAPKGATATANLRIPLGREAKAKPTYGVTLGYGKSMGAGLDGQDVTREIRMADFRMTGQGRIAQAKFASFDLANLDQDRRMNLTGGDNTMWIIVGLVAAGVAVCLLAECFDGNDEDSSD